MQSRRQALLAPFLLTFRNRFLPRGAMPVKAIVVGLFSLLLCWIIFAVTTRVVTYFDSQNELGIILSLKIFQMAWITFFAMLVFSCMVSAVSTIFLSADNEIIFAGPVAPREIFLMRFLTTTIYTSWMMLIFSLPLFAAYGQVFKAGLLYWPLLLLGVTATALAANGFGMLITILLVNLFPARRTKDIVLYLSLCFGIFIYIMFRLLRPEDLVNPDKFSQFVDYLSTISTPAGPYVPAAWAANMLSTYLLDRQIDWLLIGLLTTTPLSLFFLGEWAMDRWFFRGYTKAQESFGGHRRFAAKSRYRPGIGLAIFGKEARSFLRDSAEWSQLFMICALVVVYLYNFKFLPVNRSIFEEEYVTNLISFLNIGLTGFVVTSLAARFVYPAIGSEGGAFPIIQSSPLALRRFLLYKYLFYAIPFTLLSLLLVTVSDHLLNISGPMWWLSIATSTLITLTVVALALGFGAIHADFKVENRAAALGSLGAVLFLFTAMAFNFTVIFLGALPFYRLVSKWLRGKTIPATDIGLLGLWVVASLLLAAGLALYFLSRGIKKLENPE